MSGTGPVTDYTVGMAVIIRASGERVAATPANGAYFSVAELQAAVGGYAEIVALGPGPYPLMIVNEDGHSLGLPINSEACSLYRSTPIVGDVLLCRRSQVR